jgi:hypothetical protein
MGESVSNSLNIQMRNSISSSFSRHPLRPLAGSLLLALFPMMVLTIAAQAESVVDVPGTGPSAVTKTGSAARGVTPVVSFVSGDAVAGYFPLASPTGMADVFVAADDWPVAQIAARDLVADVERVTGRTPVLKKGTEGLSENAVLVGTLGKSPVIDRLVKEGRIDVQDVRGQWESFVIATLVDPMPGVRRGLIIAGSDRRGTAYGVYELSKLIGVSPWYWWADVAPARREALYVSPERLRAGPPSVKYRGIFINDEMWGLRPWAMKTLAPEEGHGLGPKTYSKIFELLLRLKANHVWPAMHNGEGGTIPFNCYEQNRVVADEYAIVMGSSHIEPMLRNNISGAEWDREYPGEPWDYVVNKDHIYKYWEDRIKANGRYENVYTVGKRGRDDEEGKDVTVPVLERIIADQRTILGKWVDEDVAKVPQVLIAYTEVLELYNRGLKVPDDVILCWPDDNYGYIRQLPDAREQKRSGGSGVYYHFQWLNGASDAYTWLCTTPPGLVWEEMKKAYDYNARKFWVVNVGDIKPAEIDLEYFMQMAWDITRWNNSNTREFLIQWATRDFGEPFAAPIADIMEKHYQLGYARRPEHMVMQGSGESIKWDWFSLVNYNDEAQQRVDAYDGLIRQVDELYGRLPLELKDAFFQMVLYNVKCAALHNKKVIYAQKSGAYGSEKRASAADYARKARAAADEIDEIIRHYNTGLLTVGGKWNHMASLPGPWGGQWHQWDMPPLSEYAGEGPACMNLSLEGGRITNLPDFSVNSSDKRFIDVFNSGTGNIPWNASVSDKWIKLSEMSGQFKQETRVWVTIDRDLVPQGDAQHGVITISGTGRSYDLTVTVLNPATPSGNALKGFVESQGYIAMEAEHYSRKADKGGAGWDLVDGLGRNGASVTVLPPTVSSRTNVSDIIQNSPLLEYDTYLFSTGAVSITINCVPTQSINAEHGRRLAVAFDGDTPQLVSPQRGSVSVIDNMMALHSKHQICAAGQHTLKIWMADPGVVLDKIVIDTGGVKASYMGPPESDGNPDIGYRSAARRPK